MIARKRSVGVGGALLALVAACASTAERRPTAPRVEPSALDRVRWDAATGRLGCAGGHSSVVRGSVVLQSAGASSNQRSSVETSMPVLASRCLIGCVPNTAAVATTG